ncbi:MAG: carboxypeptidase regulatory-like domain-containing protein [Bryobacterales bacterium]|nr:carboxypeptidase regulatory-like domain-containing protein [Bryobacterales bacterium]
MRHRFVRLVLLGLAALSAAFAQSQGTIQGVVTDDSGAVIPGAKVVVSNDATGVQNTRTTNEVGFYTAPGLNPGPYTVTVSSDGFSTSEQEGINLEVAQTLGLNIQLSVGQLTEVVEVSAAAQLLQSEKTEVGQVIDSKRILEMPLNGRNYLELAKFSVGVLPSRELGKGTRQDGERGGEGGILAVGMHAAQTNVLLDGADNSSRNSGGALGFQAQATKASVDAVGEFKVVTNNMSAEYGYRMGAKVLVSTKSGTNRIHGSLYEFIRNDKLDGTNFFANRVGASKPTLRRNQYGGTIGGPFIKNKLFGFFSFQGTKERAGQSFTSSVPSRAAIGGDFSAQPNPDREIYDPATLSGTGSAATRAAFPNFIIPASRFDPVAKGLLELYPTPNIPGRTDLRNNYFYSPSDSIDHNQYDMKVDWNITNATRMFARYSIRDEFVVQNGPLPAPAIGGTGQTVDLPGQNWAAALNTTISATKFNEVRFGYTYFPTRFDIPITEPLNEQFGIKGAPGDSIDDGLDQGFALSIPAGFRSLGPRAFWPNVNKMDNMQISDNFTMVKGKHTLKMGVEHRWTDIPRSPSRFRRGQFNFAGVYTAEQPNVAASRGSQGSSVADMLLGLANNGTWGWPNGEEYITRYYGAFIQDDYKITNRLTMNIGIRYELFGVPTFPNPNSNALNVTVGRFVSEFNGRPFDPREGLAPADGGFSGDDYLPFFERPTSSSDSGGEADKNNFAPRIGFAFRANEKTVIRVGAGIFYGESDNVQGESARFNTGSPFSNEYTNPQPRENSTFLVQDGFPAAQRTGLPRASLSVETKQPGVWPQFYSGQWFLDIQRELPGNTLLTIGYNGTSTSQIAGAINYNRPITPDPTIRQQDRRIRPFFNNVNLRGSQFLNQNYNSLTLKAEKRFTQGLTFLSSFTWSHNIDVQNENLTQGTASQQRYTYLQSIDRGNASLDRRLSYVTSVIYELPFGKGKPYLNSGVGRWVLGGWQVGGILNLLGGTPDSHTFNQDTTNVGGANRGDVIGDINLPSSQRTIDRWFNTDAIGPGQPGVIDNAGRNMVWGPGTKAFDFSLSRRFTITERQSLQLRFESFNFTNTPVFGRPNTAIGTANAGVITTAGEPRRIQFGLKYAF